MSSDNETVAEILSEMRIFKCRNLATLKLENCGTTQTYFADRIEAAHKREIEELNFKLMTSKSEQKTAANVIIEQTNKVEKLEREIAELRECLQEACDTVCSDGLVGCKGTFAYGSKCCLLAECEYHKWRKALEGGHDGN